MFLFELIFLLKNKDVKYEAIEEDHFNERTEILSDSDNITKRTINDFRNIQQQLDNCTDSTGPSVFFNTPIRNEFINLKNRGIKLRFITEITKDNANYCKELLKIVELRHLDNIKGNFGIADGRDYGASAIIKEGQPPVELIRSNVRAFVDQQQFLFETLWDKAVPANQKIKEIEEGIKPVKTIVLEKQEDVFESVADFYRGSILLKSCSPIEIIDLIFNNFLNLHQEILERYRKGSHKGIRWITVLNKEEDIELIKKYADKAIEIRHVKDLLSTNFALSDKAFLLTIEKIEEGKWGNNVLSSNDKLYLEHYDLIFENLWKKGIDINDRIKEIKKGNFANVDVIPNPKESLKLTRKLFKNAKKEILFILSSYTSILRFENNMGFEFFDDLVTNNRIKVKILIPFTMDSHNKINQIKSSYTKIEFRTFYTNSKSLIGITIIDRDKVLLVEIRDDLKKSKYLDSIDTTIFIEGASTAMSYLSIFNSLWKQAELNDELKKAYDTIHVHDKMQREFIDIAAHELRTPIHPMLGFIEILRNRLTDREQLEFLDIILKNTKRLKKLSEDILEVSKIENNLLILNKEDFKIKEMLLQMISDYKTEAESKETDIRFIDKCIDNDLFIYADKDKIRQVISNLISNSIKFIPQEKGGKISISIKKRTKDKEDRPFYDGENSHNFIIIITIKDNGVGIDKDIFPRLFTKFASKSFHGTGLGLYICKNIIEAHGGMIWAENNNDGKGATFSLSLPFDKK